MKLALVSRDGVINQLREGGVTHRTQLSLIPGSVEALAQLSQLGYQVVILTQQPGISRGLLDLDELEAIHTQITSSVEEAGGEIAGIFYCPHDAADRCQCRPPESGLLDVVAIEFDSDLKDVDYFFHCAEEKQLAESKGCNPIYCDGDQQRLALAIASLNE